MKKILLTALTLSLLVLPLGGTALAGNEEAINPAGLQDHLPGDVPAETTAVETMEPAIHAAVLAMLNHDVSAFDFSDGELAWETLYNMLSLYGQLDVRSEIQDGMLLLPGETVQDYGSALNLDPDQLVPLPASVQDRINYDNVSRCYLVVCGEDGLAQIQVEEVSAAGTALQLTGSLVYAADGQVLARFQATIQPQDNMFGFGLSALTLTN